MCLIVQVVSDKGGKSARWKNESLVHKFAHSNKSVVIEHR